MRSTALLSALAFVSLAACSDNTGVPGGTSGTVTLDTFESAYYRALCTTLFTCPQSGDAAQAIALMGDAATCETLLPRLGVGNVADLVAQSRAGSIRFNATAAGECLTRVRTACVLDDTEVAQLCKDAFTGTVAIGGMCSRQEQCVTGAWCDHGDSGARACPGTCRARVALGGACTLDRACVGGDTGAATCLGSRCVAVQTGAAAAEGQPCGRNETATTSTRIPCASGLVCNGATCRRPVAAGGTCTNDDLCAAGTLCAPGASGTARTCVAPSAVVRTTVGGACSGNPAAPPICNPLLRLECVSGACASMGDGVVGARCTPGNDLLAGVCNTGLRCDTMTSTCQPKLATGMACTRNSDCVSNECESDRCLANVCD